MGSVMTPRKHRRYSYRQTVPMGRTLLGRVCIERALLEVQTEWTHAEYDLFSRNCVTFCDALCRKLGVGPVPPWINSLGETLNSLPGIRLTASAISRTGWFGEPTAVSPVLLAPQEWRMETSLKGKASKALPT